MLEVDSLRITEVGTSVAAGLEHQTQKEAHMDNLIKVKPMRRDKKILLGGASLLLSSLVLPWMYDWPLLGPPIVGYVPIWLCLIGFAIIGWAWHKTDKYEGEGLR